MACVTEKPSSSFWMLVTDVKLFQISVALASITTVFTTVRSFDSGVSLDSNGANTTGSNAKQLTTDLLYLTSRIANPIANPPTIDAIRNTGNTSTMQIMPSMNNTNIASRKNIIVP